MTLSSIQQKILDYIQTQTGTDIKTKDEVKNSSKNDTWGVEMATYQNQYDGFISSKDTDLNKDGISSIGEILSFENTNNDIDENEFKEQQMNFLANQLEKNKDKSNFFDINNDGTFTEQDKIDLENLLKDTSLSTSEVNFFQKVSDYMKDLPIKIKPKVVESISSEDYLLSKISDLVSQIDKDGNGKISVLEKLKAICYEDFNSDDKHSVDDVKIYSQLMELIQSDENFLKNLKSKDVSNFSETQMTKMQKIVELIPQRTVTSPIERTHAKMFEDIKELYKGLDTDKISEYLEQNPDAKMIKYKNDEGKWIHVKLNDDKSINCTYVNGRQISMTKNEDGSITKQFTGCYSVDENGNFGPGLQSGLPPIYDKYTLYPDGKIVYEKARGPHSYEKSEYSGCDLNEMNVDSDIDLSKYQLEASLKRDYLQEIESTYDKNGNIISSTGKYDFDGNGTYDLLENWTHEYDENGNITRSQMKEDSDNNGSIDITHNFEYELDKNGNPSKTTHKAYQGDEEKVLLSFGQMTNTYDSDGNLLATKQEYDVDGNGSIDEVVNTMYDNDLGFILETKEVYDADGKVKEEMYQVDKDGDGNFDKSWQMIYKNGETIEIETDYDLNGNILNRKEAYDSDNDNIIDSSSETNYEYDENGNRIKTIHKRDQNNDGIIDYILEYENDENGNIVNHKKSHDYDGDGTIDSVKQIQYEYDENGNVLKETTKMDRDGDGTVDDLEELTYEYDENGNITKKTEYLETEWQTRIQEESYKYDEYGNIADYLFKRDDEADGKFDYTYQENSEYDENGNILKRSEKSDLDGDGTIDSVNYDENEYDSQGRLIKTKHRYDADNDGNDNYYNEESFKYDEKGNVIERRTYGGWDSDDDGRLDNPVERIYDSEGNYIQKEYEGDKCISHMQYDSKKRPIKKFDENGNTIANVDYDNNKLTLKISGQTLSLTLPDIAGSKFSMIDLERIYEYMITPDEEGNLPSENDLQKMLDKGSFQISTIKLCGCQHQTTFTPLISQPLQPVLYTERGISIQVGDEVKEADTSSIELIDKVIWNFVLDGEKLTVEVYKNTSELQPEKDVNIIAGEEVENFDFSTNELDDKTIYDIVVDGKSIKIEVPNQKVIQSQ